MGHLLDYVKSTATELSDIEFDARESDERAGAQCANVASKLSKACTRLTVAYDELYRLGHFREAGIVNAVHADFVLTQQATQRLVRSMSTAGKLAFRCRTDQLSDSR